MPTLTWLTREENVSLSDEVTLQCSKTGMNVAYTPDRTKYS